MFIMKGLPGSGKSTIVKTIQEVYKDSVVCSADFYFMKSGKLVWVSRMLLECELNALDFIFSLFFLLLSFVSSHFFFICTSPLHCLVLCFSSSHPFSSFYISPLSFYSSSSSSLLSNPSSSPFPSLRSSSSSSLHLIPPPFLSPSLTFLFLPPYISSPSLCLFFYSSSSLSPSSSSISSTCFSSSSSSTSSFLILNLMLVHPIRNLEIEEKYNIMIIFSSNVKWQI